MHDLHQTMILTPAVAAPPSVIDLDRGGEKSVQRRDRLLGRYGGTNGNFVLVSG